ncbi:hypothetical protein HMPREF9065_02136 [Aggregatibacter sp. oral taxon 458 str. W10330]|uniref:AAA family ATPase n=1 Tax=Aggregatibacter sp. oral taxon 458 TaxID=712148 RepID=UPI0003985E19|nr:AAA family ATPase [Aggregatibacter sp. oral taxon 458]ERH26091.1 hypothetical protein HMPREF9065_02136 [Aggregatibacter sp. oral taxon 458 str. W10330]
MNNRTIQLNLSKFRAINEANIDLNGISVVSGINGSGKSTLSKILYYFFKISNNFEAEVYKNYESDMTIIKDGLYYITRNFPDKGDNYSIRNIYDLFNVNVMALDEFSEKKNRIINFIKSVSKDYDKVSRLNNDQSLDNILYAVNSLIFKKDLKSNFFDSLIKKVDSVFNQMEKDIDEKPSVYFKKELGRIFNTYLEPSLLEVKEMKNRLFSYDEMSFSSSLFINNTIYIDNPMAFENNNDNYDYWNDLNILLYKKSSNHSNNICEIIVNDVLEADINKDDMGNRLVYQRKFDSLMLDLQECATGIKSIGVIYTLIKNGSINDKTLLIIDEPEVYLHPQWIVEYARILVLIHKYIGCHIFISSHSPDMIQAIRYISEKQDVLESLDFYLAHEDNNRKYTYRHLSKDIEPIFECFNISLHKIEKYSI